MRWLATVNQPRPKAPAVLDAGGMPEGAVSADGRVIGTYIHGLFTDDQQRSAWLAHVRAARTDISYETLVEETLDQVAAHLAAHVDLDAVLTLAR